MEYFDFVNASDESTSRITSSLPATEPGIVGADTLVDQEVESKLTRTLSCRPRIDGNASGQPTTLGSGALYQSLDCQQLEGLDNTENANKWLQAGLRSSSPCDHCRGRQLECLIENKWEFEWDHPVEYPQNASEGVALDAAATNIPLQRFASSGSSINDIEACPEPRKRNTRFSQKSVRILKRWFRDHREHPYPTDEEKIELISMTGLKRFQISNWFANARRRSNLQEPHISSPSSIDASHGFSISIPHPNPRGYEDTDPIERWRNSPPEDEPASVVDIMKAICQASLPLGTESTHNSTAFSQSLPNSTSPFTVFRASSMTSCQSSGSSSYSTNSIASSTYSDQPLGSFGSRKRVRRRRRPSLSKSAVGIQDWSSSMFQCTFCSRSFKTQYNWSRHESSVHLPQQAWICSPLGSTLHRGNSPPLCAFCDAPNPDTQHLEKHQHLICLERPIEERTFSRKDHLRQHLRLVHDCAFTERMEDWEYPLERVSSRCGFCNMNFDSWNTRTEHVAAHYRSGARIDQWMGSLGLAPHVLAMVQAPGNRILKA